MDGFLRRHAARILGFAAALAALASLVTFHPLDPTLTNLRYPKDGVGNWLGYSGALLGGSLVEAFGIAALLVPLLIANLFFTARNRPAWHRYGLHGASILLVVAAALGLRLDVPALGLRGPGLVGWTAGQWLRATAGVWPGMALLAFALAYSLNRVIYAPQLRRILGDAQILSGFGVRQLSARGAAWWRLARPQTGWAWHELLMLPPQGLLFAAGWLWERGIAGPLLRPIRRALQGWRERRYSVARVKSNPAAPMVPASAFTPSEQPRFHALPIGQIQDTFAHWLEEPPPGAGTPPASEIASYSVPGQESPTPPSEAPLLPRSPQPPVPTGSGDRVARWEEYLRRYKENLDLDWDERSWKRKRLEELSQDREEGDAPNVPHSPK